MSYLKKSKFFHTFVPRYKVSPIRFPESDWNTWDPRRPWRVRPDSWLEVEGELGRTGGRYRGTHWKVRDHTGPPAPFDAQYFPGNHSKTMVYWKDLETVMGPEDVGVGDFDPHTDGPPWRGGGLGRSPTDRGGSPFPRGVQPFPSWRRRRYLLSSRTRRVSGSVGPNTLSLSSPRVRQILSPPLFGRIYRLQSPPHVLPPSPLFSSDPATRVLEGPRYFSQITPETWNRRHLIPWKKKFPQVWKTVFF